MRRWRKITSNPRIYLHQHPENLTEPGQPYQDNNDLKSITDETDSETDLTMDFQHNPPIAEPVKPSPPGRKPGKLPDTVIPQRRPTQPTLVTRKSFSAALNDSAELDFTLENDLMLKRKPVERQQTNKHKKRK